MSRLAEQQSALLDALFAWPPEIATENVANYLYPTRTRGLKTYQANGHMLAQRALSTAYPVLFQLLGEESFAALASDFWHRHPPQRGDLAQWGEGLSVFIQGNAQLADVPYLGDVARVEWALHRCATSADLAVQSASFALLADNDPDDLDLLLSPGCSVVRSPWPVASAVSAHLAAPVAGQPDLSEVNRKLRSGSADVAAETALIWRYHFQPRVREALPGEADFVDALLAGQSLGEALPDCNSLDFGGWLPLAVQSGLLLGVEVRSA